MGGGRLVKSDFRSHSGSHQSPEPSLDSESKFKPSVAKISFSTADLDDQSLLLAHSDYNWKDYNRTSMHDAYRKNTLA